MAKRSKYKVKLELIKRKVYLKNIEQLKRQDTERQKQRDRYCKGLCTRWTGNAPSARGSVSPSPGIKGK